MKAPAHGCLRLYLLAVILEATLAQAAEEPAAAPQRSNALSARILGEVLAQLPKYDPLASLPEAWPGKAGDDEVAADTFLLPEMEVKPNKLGPLTKFELTNPQGRLELALKTHPGLKLGPFAKLNDGIAHELQTEEREVVKRDAIADRVQSLALIDDIQSKEELKLMQAATAPPTVYWDNWKPNP